MPEDPQNPSDDDLEIMSGEEIIDTDLFPPPQDVDEDDKQDNSALPVPAGTSSLVALDPLSAYLNEIRQYPSLTEDEEQKLARHYHETGDVEAAYRLATDNLLLVVKIAMTFKREWENMMDLIQEGNVGLMKAVQNFDPFRGVRLPAYASWWIKAYILKFILDNWRMVKVGTTNTRRKLLYNLRKEKEKLEKQGFTPTTKRLADHFGVDEQEVIDVEKSLGAYDVSMETPTHPDSALTPLDSLAAKTSIADDAEEKDFQEILRKKIFDFMENLRPVEKELFATRILSEDPRSLKEIGENYKITREAVRQTEQRLLKRLKLYLTEHMPEAKDYFKD